MVTCLDHRVIKCFVLEGTFKDHLVQSSCHRQGHLSLDQVAQNAVQPDFEHFQGGSIHNVSGPSVPVPHYPHSQEFLPSYI